MLTTRLYFLGPVQLYRDDQLVDLNIAKVQALLAYLAITGVPQTREHLLSLLWAESHPDAARKNLRNRLWRMRQVLGDDVVVAEGDALTLSSSDWTDVSAFETGLSAHLAAGSPADDQLQAALNLWRGPLLAGLTLSESPDFELWLTGERERLGQMYLRGLNHLLAAHRAASQWQDVITVAHRALAYDNTQELIHTQLMETYARLGQRTDALRQYDILRTILARELAVEPLPETQTLRAKIFGGELASSMTVSEPLPVSRQSGKSHRSANRPFVGRRREREVLDESLKIAAGGELQIVLISGELGIGKSHLWQQWSAMMPAETVVLETRCLDTMQALPFAPLTGLLGTQICMEQISSPQSPVSPIWLTELARLLPEICNHRPELPPVSALPPEEEQRRLFEAFVQTLRALNATPLVLFIDDLHWADQATLDWLVYLTDRMRREPLLLVGSYRTHEAPPALAHHIAGWKRESVGQHLPLSHLTLQEATELITALGGQINVIDYLHTQSSGNPYYLIELNHVYPDGAPAALVDLISARLQSLPKNALRLLQVAAILEPAISFEMLQRVGNQSEDETLDALDALLDTAILVERGDNYEFAHPLLAGIVYDGLSTPRRKRLHQRVAEHLRTIYQDSLDAIDGQLARHYAEAGQLTEAVRYAEMAAVRAFQMGAMTEAVNFSRQAYALEPTTARQLDLGYALMHVSGGMQEARTAIRQALAESESNQDQAGIVQASLHLASSYLSTEEGEKILDWAKRISAYLEESDNVELRATVQYLMGQGKFHTTNALTEAASHFKEATRLATAHHLVSDIALQSWFGWGNLSVQCGDFVEAQAKFKHTLTLAQATQNIYFEALSYNNLAYAALLAGDLAAARSTIDTGLDFVNRHELMQPRQYLYSTRGEIALAEGALEASASWFAQALAEAQSYENTTHVANVWAHLGRVAQAQGDFERAETLLQAARSTISDAGARHLQIQIALWLAELYLTVNDKPAARTALNTARKQLTGSRRKALQAIADQLAEQVGA